MTKNLLFLSLTIVALTFLTTTQGAEDASFKERTSDSSGPLDNLIVNPKSVLDHIHHVRDKLAEKYKNKSEKHKSSFIPESEVEELMKEARQNSPIFLIGECIKEDWGPCLLSRSHAPQYRNHFENETVTTLIKQIESEEAPIHYTGFACGGMFQDLVVLTKTLAQKPNASLAIHLIDLEHTPYVACQDLIGPTREVKPTESLDPHKVIDQLMERAKKEKWVNEKDCEGDKLEDTKKQFTDICKDYDEKAKQFVSYLQRTFPDAQLSLYLHESSDSYLKYRHKHNLPYPHVVTAVDIKDEMSLLKSSTMHFAELVERTLKSNQRASVISLDKNNSYGHPHPETLETLGKYDITVLRTDMLGDIKILCDSQSLKLK